MESLTFPEQPASLYEPIKFSLDLGGKRLRPVLLLIANELYGGKEKEALPAALAIEVFHNFTLMHDDIMDKAPLRRGKPTVHEKWDTNSAILSGDQMLVWAYSLLSGTNEFYLSQAYTLFNETAKGVCEGQRWDMDFEQLEKVDDLQYIQMITLKTAVLLAASLQMGALLAGADEFEQKHIYQFGLNLGISFQLQDDLLDVFGSTADVGKIQGGDIVANKKTYLWIVAHKLANDENQKQLLHWSSNKNADQKDKIRAVKKIYETLGIPALAEERKSYFYMEALKHLDQLSLPQEKKNILQGLAQNLMDRIS